MFQMKYFADTIFLLLHNPLAVNQRPDYERPCAFCFPKDGATYIRAQNMALRSAQIPRDGEAWTEATWQLLEQETRQLVLTARSPAKGWAHLVRAARRVMRAYTTSFFIVSRFLPRHKRERVELIYAAVRYPDEVVDTFPLSASARLERLDAWASAYERALECRNLRESLESDVPCFLAGFREVVREADIPADHYRAFLSAMRRDVQPRPFADLDDLIESYIYGSAIVVGYFLTHVYGASSPDLFPKALEAARDLGIALQLTNFLRDVADDDGRGRLYLPQTFLESEGLVGARPNDPQHSAAFARVVKRLAGEAARYYERAASGLSAFAADSRLAIRACIEVYGLLNQKILEREGSLDGRASVPFRDKWRVLPPSKYWRIPWSYLLP